MRIGEIQGLRALAVLLVIAFHAKFLHGGFVGVDIFYVISGYLITGLLVRELDETGTISFRKFYSRRIKRLLPSSFLVLISTAVFGFIFMPANLRADLGRNLVATALYVGNYLFAWWQNDYQNLGATPSPVIHYWSLAVEEQFYLLWPLLILLAGRNHSTRRIFKIVLSVTLGSFLLSIIATSHWPIWSFYSLPTRAWELGIGALVVFSKRPLARYRWLPWIALLALAYSTVKFNETTPFPGSAAAVPTVATGIFLLMIRDLPSPIAYLLRARVSQWIGAVSYPLYLWHWPVLVLPLFIIHHPLSLFQRTLFIALTFVLAALTHHFLEDPLRLARTSTRRVFTLASVTTIVSVILGITISISSAQSINIPSAGAPISLKGVTRTPAIYTDGCQLDKNATVSPPCTYGDTSGSKTFVLFGDSHAAQWFPTLNAIALKHSLKLIVLTKSSCPAASVDLSDQGAFRNAPCKLWRENSMLRIEKLHPWVVFMSSYDHYQPPPSASDRNLWWKQGNKTTADRLKLATSHLILLADTPWPSRDIPSCLTQSKPSSCTTTRPTTLLKGLESNAVVFVDPTNWFCNQTCPAVKENIVVYRDASHMSVDFALHLAPDLTKILIARHIILS